MCSSGRCSGTTRASTTSFASSHDCHDHQCAKSGDSHLLPPSSSSAVAALYFVARRTSLLVVLRPWTARCIFIGHSHLLSPKTIVDYSLAPQAERESIWDKREMSARELPTKRRGTELPVPSTGSIDAIGRLAESALDFAPLRLNQH